MKKDRVVLEQAVHEFAEYFQSNPESAASLVATGDSDPNAEIDATELAAWTMVANILLNRDDVINLN